MNKTLLSAGIAVSLGLGASTAQAAFTQLGAGNYKATITGGCFAFGTCSYVGDGSGSGEFTGNTAGQATTTVTTAVVTTRATGSTIGSGTTGSDSGEIIFSLDAAGNMTVTSYRQDSYLNTAGGTFFVDALGPTGVSNFSGAIDSSGGISFTPSGREGMAYDFYSSLGTLPWNIIPGSSPEAFDSFSTGTETAIKGKSSVTLTGTPLQDAGALTWTGVIVSAGNVNGDYWGGFTNTLYTEQFNLTIECTDTGEGACAPAVIPVPAAVWLFGSGLLGLVGVARRRRNS